MTDHQKLAEPTTEQPPTAAGGYSREQALQRYSRSLRHKKPPSPPRRPWMLAALTLVCAAVVIVGSVAPWVRYETVSEADAASNAWTLYGFRTDGAFSLLFAVVSIVALLIALFRRDAGAIAWIALGAMALCALVGLANWLMFAPPEVSLEPGEEGTSVRVEWGAMVVGLAGAAGTVATYIIARIMNPN